MHPTRGNVCSLLVGACFCKHYKCVHFAKNPTEEAPAASSCKPALQRDAWEFCALLTSFAFFFSLFFFHFLPRCFLCFRGRQEVQDIIMVCSWARQVAPEGGCPTCYQWRSAKVCFLCTTAADSAALLSPSGRRSSEVLHGGSLVDQSRANLTQLHLLFYVGASERSAWLHCDIKYDQKI